MSFEYPRNISFRCQRCALCCGDTKDKVRSILLLKAEAHRISKKSLKDLYRFARRIENFGPYIYEMRMTEEGKCVFLKKNSCSIYEIRPLVCRFFPFHLKNVRAQKYVFNYTDECPGIGKGQRLKKDFFKKLFRSFINLMRENEITLTS